MVRLQFVSAFFGTVVWYNSIKWFGEGDDDMLWEFEVAGVRSWVCLTKC